MVGVAGGGVGFWPDTKSGGGGVLSVCGPIRRARGRRGDAVGFWPDTRSGGGGGGGGGGGIIAYQGAWDIVQ